MVLQHEKCEHLGVLNDLLSQHSVTCRYVKLYEGENIPEIKEYSGIIVLGGPMNVYEEEEYPFLRAEDSLIKEALKRRKPTLGICLGAQLIAKAAGAKVFHGVRKEIGWYPIRLTEEGRADKVFRGLEEQFAVFQWHGDTFDIPAGGVRLAGSTMFQNQAFSIEARGYALQFHLEVTYQMVSDWMKRYEDELASLKGEVDPEGMLRDSEKYIQALNRRASILCSNFVRLLE